jgi:hypothetical protein
VKFLTTEQMSELRDTLLNMGFSVNVRSWRTHDFESVKDIWNTPKEQWNGPIKHQVKIAESFLKMSEAVKLIPIAEKYGLDIWITGTDEDGCITFEFGVAGESDPGLQTKLGE